MRVSGQTVSFPMTSRTNRISIIIPSHIFCSSHLSYLSRSHITIRLHLIEFLEQLGRLLSATSEPDSGFPYLSRIGMSKMKQSEPVNHFNHASTRKTPQLITRSIRNRLAKILPFSCCFPAGLSLLSGKQFVASGRNIFRSSLKNRHSV